MSIPDFQSLMLPVLKASADGEVKISDVVSTLGLSLELSEQELSELLPSGKQTTFANRVNWAKSYLGKAGMVTLTRRGYFQISQKGKDVLKSQPPAINTKYLEMLAGLRPGKTVHRCEGLSRGDKGLLRCIGNFQSIQRFVRDDIFFWRSGS